MALGCSADPVACIDLVALFIGEFLKDWTTMVMLSLLLGLLLKLRADRRQADSHAYAEQMLAYEKRRADEAARTGQTWRKKPPAQD